MSESRPEPMLTAARAACERDLCCKECNQPPHTLFCIQANCSLATLFPEAVLEALRLVNKFRLLPSRKKSIRKPRTSRAGVMLQPSEFSFDTTPHTPTSAKAVDGHSPTHSKVSSSAASSCASSPLLSDLGLLKLTLPRERRHRAATGQTTANPQTTWRSSGLVLALGTERRARSNKSRPSERVCEV